MRFTEHMRRLIAARETGSYCGIFRYNDKLAGRQLAMECDVPIPQLVVSPFELDRAQLGPGRDVVVKPLHGCSGRGVLPLRYVEDGVSALYELLWDDVRKPHWNSMRAGWASWMATLEEIENGFRGTGGEIRGPYIGEELIPGPQGQPLATVWKVYCIHGRPIWARQIQSTARRGGQVECWELGEGKALRIGYDLFTNHPLQKYEQLPPPVDPPALHDYARMIAEAIQERTDSPFVRIDLLEGPDGRVVFGEITPHPSGGNDDYRPEWDEKLGRIWSRGP